MKPWTIELLSSAAAFSSVFFIPVFSRDLGVHELEIGLIVALYSLSLFVSNYLFGRWADVHGRRRVIQVGLVLSSLASLTQILAQDGVSLAVARVLVGLSAGIYPAALYVYVYESKLRIGRFASFGALGWGVGTIAVGILGMFWKVFLLSSFLFFLSFLFALLLTPITEVKVRVPLFPRDVIKRNLTVYGAVLVRHTGANAIWVIFPLFLLDLGMDLFSVGVLYAVNSGTQFLIMWSADRFKSYRLVSFGLLLSSVTFLLFTLARNFLEVFPTQILLGISWATIYVGSLKYVMERNVERATSTGLLNSVLSISSILGPLLGGTIVGVGLSVGLDKGLSYRLTMYSASIMAVASFIGFCSSLKKKEASGQL